MKKPELKLYTVVYWIPHLDEDRWTPDFVIDFGMQIEAFCREEARNVFIEYNELDITFNSEVSVIGIFEEGECDDDLNTLRFEDRPLELQKIPRHIGNLNKYYEISDAQRTTIYNLSKTLNKPFHGITRFEAFMYIKDRCAEIANSKTRKATLIHTNYEDIDDLSYFDYYFDKEF